MTCDEARLNKATVRRIFESVWNEAQFDGIEHIWAADAPVHRRDHVRPYGPEGLKQMVLRWRKAFPDFRFVVEGVIGDTDRVAIRVRFTGTHTGAEWFRLPLTGKPIEVTEMNVLPPTGGEGC